MSATSSGHQNEQTRPGFSWAAFSWLELALQMVGMFLRQTCPLSTLARGTDEADGTDGTDEADGTDGAAGAVGRDSRWPREPRTRELRVLGDGVSALAGLSQPRLGRASGMGDGTQGALQGAL